MLVTTMPCDRGRQVEAGTVHDLIRRCRRPDKKHWHRSAGFLLGATDGSDG